MYHAHFQLREPPFSIAPDPSYLYLSARHQEALGHLLYGTGQYGGFVQLTGEVGTGKTTLIRTLLEQRLDNVVVAMIHNPRQSEAEFVQSICDELAAPYNAHSPSLKSLVDALNRHLIALHEQGKRAVLIIDEAQQLKPEVLEQVRLLTNLETQKEKLLRIMLVGQPELADLLARQDLRQLAQRITARYHLTPLSATETAEYLQHRVQVAGGRHALFTPGALRAIHREAQGIPRLINVVADRSLLAAYAKNAGQVDAPTVKAAAADVRGEGKGAALAGRGTQHWSEYLPHLPEGWREPLLRGTQLGLIALAGFLLLGLLTEGGRRLLSKPSEAKPAATPVAIAEAPLHGPGLAPPPAPFAPEPAPKAKAKPEPAAKPVTAKDATLTQPPTPAATGDLAKARSASAPLNEQMLRLARLWRPGFRLGRGENACRSLHRQQLECLKGQGGWRSLRQMDSPALIGLRDGRDTRYLVLTALGQKTARVLGPKGEESLSLKWLDSSWNGEYLVLWKRETDEVRIGPDTRGDPILWLRKRLNERLGSAPETADATRWDAELKKALQRFQAKNGLTPNGIADGRTLMALADLQGEPRLGAAP